MQNFQHKIGQEEFQELLKEAVRQSLEKEKKQRREKYFELFKTLITPSVISVLTIWAAMYVSNKEMENTKLIVDNQIKSAKIIADQQINSTAKIADANHEIERLAHIKDIFQSIVGKNINEASIDTLKMRIASLGVYSDSSLNFLINIRNFYENRHPELSRTAEETIYHILGSSQLDVSNCKFIGEKNKVLILRQAKFDKYNLTGSKFINVNLFKAKFTQSTLQNVIFENVDLYGAVFSEANLAETAFTKGTNLRQTNFTSAKLKGVRFQDCMHLEDAIFSIYALIKANEPPFSEINRRTYIKLLVPHKEEIVKIFDSPEGPEYLEALFQKTEYEFQELVEHLNELSHNQNNGRQTTSGLYKQGKLIKKS